jgi:hypothetical protein
MSLNMLIEFGEAFDYTAPTSPAGAARPASAASRSSPSPATSSAAVAYK